jgi:Holliday junction resolvase RusA-like endonuclease
MARGVNLTILGIKPQGKIIHHVNPRTGGYNLHYDTIHYLQQLRERIQFILMMRYGWPRDFKTIHRPFRMGVLFFVEGKNHYDFTNLVKAVEDACNGLVYEDDSLRRGTCLPDGIVEHAQENAIVIRIEELDEPLQLPEELYATMEVEA